MKRILLLSAATIISAALSAQTVANMNDLKPEKKAMAVSLKLTAIAFFSGLRSFILATV